MKNTLLRTFQVIAFLAFNVYAFGQIPAGYYDAAQGLNGENLKTALHNIIKGQKEYPYTSGNTDVWDILKQADRDPDNPSNVILIYTGWSVNAVQEYNNGSGWNREHVWAKSRGDFGTTEGPGTDCHNLHASDITVNSFRNNRWFDNCTTPYNTTGCYYDDATWTWEPRDAVKGDVARTIFYMATRYEGDNGEPDLEVIDYFPANDATKEPVHAKLSTLLEWNTEDPVDDFERNRNNVVYGFQHNRNPYIDHPEYVNEVFGESVPNVLPSITNITISPNNPTASDAVYVSAQVVDPDGSLTSVTLHWGTVENTLTNTAGMLNNGVKYVAGIPAEQGGTEIFYQISATDNTGDSGSSEIFNFMVGSVGISQADASEEVMVYPVPVNHTLHISGPGTYNVRILTITGSTLKTVNGRSTIDVSDINPGVYLLRIKDLQTGEETSREVIISR